jgi:hypothetical protein
MTGPGLPCTFEMRGPLFRPALVIECRTMEWPGVWLGGFDQIRWLQASALDAERVHSRALSPSSDDTGVCAP